MGMPGWWSQRRYGMFVHASLATVPAWAPIGQYAEWYWSHLGDSLPGVLLHPQPMVEVLAHHRDRWEHLGGFDEFLPLLHFDRFDGEEWARLAVESGMGYTVMVSKHHDGLCWWDAPNTERTVTRGGPRRNVLAEYAAACERNDLVFGAYYSLLDWADPRYGTPEYTGEVLHEHVVDLVERYGASYVWGDGHWDGDPARWDSASLAAKLHSIDADVLVNDRWWLNGDHPGRPPVRTFEHQPPAGIVREPWELCRGVGSSFGHNRAERAEHHLGSFDIVALYTEVLAKGGNLLLNVGPALDGSIPELQAAPMRAAGEWIRRFADVLEPSTPWVSWGDDTTRLMHSGGDVIAIDLAGRGEFTAIDRRRFRVESIDVLGDPDGAIEAHPAAFAHDDNGLHVETARRVSPVQRRLDAGGHGGRRLDDVAVYRIRVAEVERPAELFAPTTPERTALGPLVEHAAAGDIVQLGDGVYHGPATVPPGVVVRGLGAGRTVLDGDGAAAISLQRNTRLEHVRVGGAAERVTWRPSVAVLVEGDYATVLGCEVDGHVDVRAHGATMRATQARGVISTGPARLTLSRCRFVGMRWDVGVAIVGGTDHDIDSCQFVDHLCAVRLADTTDAVVRGNDIWARWWGLRLERTIGTHAHRNQIHRTMRAVDVDGGDRVLVDGNAVFDGDSGCLVQSGAAECVVSGNYWERCRVGLLTWDAPEVRAEGNQAVDLHDPADTFVSGP
ncbi:MAG: alpha-L-fucosidase [Ilumatobacteraceae bacterium]|nr:alpha-L-fucosidase [Ilumatobacteraceae bacterium]